MRRESGRVCVGRSVVSVAFALLVAALGCGGASNDGQERAADRAATCVCELRSWVVARNGRHLFMRIDCPAEFDRLDTVVEFTSAALRRDFVGPIDPARPPRIAKMTRGVRLRSQFGPAADDRLEATFELSVEQARELQRDRMFVEAYVLLGANSNAGMLAAMGAVGLELPARVLGGVGVNGEFPGVDYPAGAELAAEKWGDFGLPGGPEAAP